MKKIKIIIIMALLICSTGCKTASSLKEEAVPKISNETVKEESQGTNELEEQSEDQSDEAIDEKAYMTEVESVRPEGSQINEEQAISVIRNYIEDDIRKQEELLYNAMGVWTLSDFHLPRGGPPSKDMAEDYLNKEITLSLSDDEISLYFNEKEYKMKYMKPVSSRYLNDIYQQTSGAREKICNNNAYEIGLTGEEGTVKVFLNDTGGAFLHIIGEVADHAFFKLCNKSMNDEAGESSFFEEKLEYIVNNCLVHYSYDNLVLLEEGSFIINEIEYDMQMLSFIEECTININGDIIELCVGSFDLQLVKIEEVNSIIYQHSCWWKSDEEEYTLVYTFKGENSVIQIVETSENKFFIISLANETEEGNIYGHTK